MKILFLSPWFPAPAVNGSKIRIYNLLVPLAKDHEVHLISFVRNDEIVDLEAMRQVCASIQTVRWREFTPTRLKALLGFFSTTPRSVIDTYSIEMVQTVGKAVEYIQPDVIIASELGTAPYARNHRSFPLILDEIQVKIIHDAWIQSNILLQKRRYKLTWLKTRGYIASLMSDFDICAAASPQEKALLEEILPEHPNLIVIPNGVDVLAFQPDIAEPEPYTLIYNGALTYSANLDAMRYFLEKVFPSILGEIPETTLKITGSTKGVNLNELISSTQITFSGFLPDIRPAVGAAWACVVPLRIGGGTRLKILEAMALGTPVISTPKGAEGLSVTHNENILIADTPQDFATQTIRLLKDPLLRERLARNARTLVETHYNWQNIGNQFTTLVSNLVSAR